MKRRETRRQRDREQLPVTLRALVQLVPAGVDVRKFLEESYGPVVPVTGHGGYYDAAITGNGLHKLLEALGEACPEGAMDLLRVARRVPRSQSTAESIDIAELCFAISQATGPVSVHERRRNAGASTVPLDEETPLLQYYKGRRFHAIVKGEDPSSPPARTASVATVASSNSGLGAGDVAEVKGSAFDDPAVVEEWRQFVACASSALPMTLRVHNSEAALQRVALRTLQQDDISVVVKPLTALPPAAGLYSCSNAAYHANKRVEYVCRTLHAASAVSFQETVSAIPVLALSLEPHHTVLDMCAAPGSKTLQALDELLRKGWDNEAVKRSVLIANEKDRVKATQTLPARLKRFHSPNVMSTRCDAVQWPRLFVTEGGSLSQYKDGEGYAPVERRFDRIVCDVPCSGDGTIRKEPSVAATWSAGYVRSLVPTQTAILRRGLDLLSDGGILVYSTCSMNPKEDEEVVCAALDLFQDAVELLDVNAILAAKGGHLLSTGGITSPNVEGLQSGTVPANYSGAKVLRVLPHRNDTGGFFVATFRKLKQLDVTPPIVVRNKLNQWTRGKLWAPVASDDPVWTDIAAFYGFDPLDARSFSYYPASCNEANAKGLVPVYHLNPNGGPTRRIVLTTPALASMIFGTRPYKGPGVEVVCVGVRAFEAYDGKFLSQAECHWRAVVESASYLSSRFTARKMLLTAAARHDLLEELLRKGYVHVRGHWQAILCDPSVSSLNAAKDERFPFVKDGRLKELLGSLTGETLSHPKTAAEVGELLPTELKVGGVLIAIKRGDGGETGPANEEPWYVSATLSGNKLELAIDASLRTYGLMAYLDIYENAIKPTSGMPVETVPTAAAPKE